MRFISLGFSMELLCKIVQKWKMCYSEGENGRSQNPDLAFLLHLLFFYIWEKCTFVRLCYAGGVCVCVCVCWWCCIFKNMSSVETLKGKKKYFVT